jgi:hypothetical protein
MALLSLGGIMASFDVAYNWMLSNEDAADLHAIVPDKCPKGCTLLHCFAISGINSGAWPSEYAVIANTPQADRGPLVEAFYQAHFWSDWFDDLTSDEVAKRVFDASVNMGSVAAVKCLQQAVNTILDDDLPVDGRLGPATVYQVNRCDATVLVSIFRQARVARYKAIAAANPALAHYLPQWIARAEK